MKKIVTLVLSLVCALCLLGCGIQQPQEQQENNNVQYFFSGKVLEVQEEYLKLEVFYIGNTNLSEGSMVEVSTDVVAAAGCPEFVIGEHARVVMAWNTEDTSTERLQALAIFKEELEDITPKPTPTLAPGQDQALPTTPVVIP